MTIRDLFSCWSLSTAHITIVESGTYKTYAEIYPRFNDTDDEDFKEFDRIADNIIVKWYINRKSNIITIYI